MSSPARPRSPALSALLALTVLSALLTACAPPSLQRHDGIAFGTNVALSYYGPRDEMLFLEFIRSLQDYENQMTIWDRELPSDVMTLNAQAGLSPRPLPPEAATVLRRALYWAEQSGGTFDPTVGPLVGLWGVATDHPKRPADSEIAAALPLVGWQKVEDRGQDGFFLTRPGMKIDLGAIAKGYGADEGARLLRARGLSGIVDISGNLFLVGSKPDRSPWRVGVQDPFKPRGQYLGVVSLSEGSLVTSGIYERYFTDEEGQRWHHILDPATGFPADSGLAGVTIVRSPSLDADALSTAVFVMGLHRGYAFVEGLADTEAVFVTTDRDLWLTPGLAEHFRLTGEFTLRTGRP